MNNAEKLPAQVLASTICVEDELAKLRAARAEVQRIWLSAQRELELVKQTRAEAERYRQEIETKARSQAQLIILQARLATKKEIIELKRKVSEEIQKILADIRMMRITAKEELAAQQKFTNAARIKALSLAFPEVAGERSESDEEAISV